MVEFHPTKFCARQIQNTFVYLLVSVTVRLKFKEEILGEESSLRNLGLKDKSKKLENVIYNCGQIIAVTHLLLPNQIF